MHYFGNPSITRGNLTATFYIDDDHVRRVRWYLRALRRFTNFRTVVLHVWEYVPNWQIAPHYLANLPATQPERYPGVFDHLQTALEPVLGHAEKDYRLEEGSAISSTKSSES